MRANWAERGEIVKTWMKQTKRRPSQCDETIWIVNNVQHVESKLHRWMTVMQNVGTAQYDAAFTGWIARNYPTRVWNSRAAKNGIIAFILQNKIRPTPHSQDPYEAYLGRALDNYIMLCRPQSYDQKFAEIVERMAPLRTETKKGWLFNSLVEFGRLPTYTRKDMSENRLAHRLHNHMSRDVRFEQFIPMVFD